MRSLFRSRHNLSQTFFPCKIIYFHSQRISIFNFIRRKTNIMKYLNVAEKNDAAKNIAAHLSRGTSRRREGFSQYNKIYEFEAEVLGQQCEMVMTSVSGHLLALEFVGTYKSWQSCNPLTLFNAPVFKYCPENYEKIKRTLEREVRGCQGLIIWTDCDREGENIGFEIIQVCTAVKSNLKVYRATFSEITSVSVHRALQNLQQPNKNISDAVDVRQELDLRIGAAFTRFQTLRLQKVFPTKLADSLVSYGSCQFPTLGFVVERYRAVENFVVEPFWKIKVNHTMNDLSVDFTWERVRLFDRDACRVLHDICTESPQAKVLDVKTKPKSKWRPLPLDTVELEKSASRKLKINAKETMRLAEKLYTQGLISYPRTETNEFPKEMNLTELVRQQVGDSAWGAFAQRVLDQGGPVPRQGNKSDQAHPPIHPTKYTNNLSGDEKRLYEFIVRSFLACCSRDAQGQETTVLAELAGERFSASGLAITARNYLDVYPYDKWSSKEIHLYETGQIFEPTSIDMVEGNTSPPNLLTEADLIALMEKHGIGTDATHADHIETIKSRSYVALSDAVHFVPGLLGMGLVEGYDAVGLAVRVSEPRLRAHLEAGLRAVCDGAARPQDVLAEQIAIYKQVYLTVTAEANKIDAALAKRFGERPIDYNPSADSMPTDMTSALKCPKCGSDMMVRRKKNNQDEFYIGCLLFPNCKNAVWFPSIVKKIEVLSDTCEICGPNYKKIKFEWRNNSISHLYPPPYVTCIGGCDTTFLELLQINLSSVRPVSENRTQSTTNSRQNSLTNNTANVVGPVRPNPNQQVPLLRQPAPPSRQNVPPPRQNAPLPAANRAPFSAVTRMRMPTVGGGAGDADDNSVMCSCNRPATLLTVRKQNENFGKKFYKCVQGRDNGGCDFFLWAPESVEGGVQNPYDTPPASSVRGGGGGGESLPSAIGSSRGWGGGGESLPSAGGTSRGWSGGGESLPSAGGTSRGWGIAPSFNRDSGPENEDGVLCNCRLPAKRITVQKEGANKGRPFYGCQKELGARCNFFQWADEGSNTREWGNASAGASASSWRGARGRGRSRGGASTRRGGAAAEASAGSGAGARRRCTLCRQEGHNRGRCPNNQP